ncbi:MAG: hypothetical protein RLZZ592_221 [Pseudomonadota bacterium]|jgi:serine/threonine-protein kinase
MTTSTTHRPTALQPPSPAEAVWRPTDPGSVTETLPAEPLPFEQQIGAALDLSLPGETTAPTAPLETATRTAPSPPAAPSLIPDAQALLNQNQMGRYVLERPLGAGGLGTVWSAYDTVLTRRVAVKTLPLAVPDAERDPLVSRVLDEARAAARLSHPHIVTVHDAGVSPDGAYIAMELLRGKDLSQMLRSGWRPSGAQAALIVRRVADALSYAHGKGVVHRDIKPGNIFMVGRTRPVVLDFGIAQLLHQAESIGGPALGSPYYAAPEQFDGRECDPRTDVYSLGVVLYELLCGQRPYLGGTLAEIRASVRAGCPLHPCEVDTAVPVDLAEIALKAIRISPDERHRTAGTMARALRAWLSTHPETPESQTSAATAPVTVQPTLPPPVSTLTPPMAAPAVSGASALPMPSFMSSPTLSGRPPGAMLRTLLTVVLVLLLLIATLLWART